MNLPRLEKLFVLVSIYCTLTLQVQAQSYYFKNYQVNNGISSNTITCILQDRKGFMWYGTRNGLNRFDGHFFKIFRNNSSDPTSLGSNSILSLFEDRSEKLWVGTYKGISIFDPKTESFSYFPTIPQGEIRSIKGDNRGNTWIIADHVLYRYNSRSNKVSSYLFPNALTTNISISSSGAVWIATNTGYIKMYNATTDSFTTYDVRITTSKYPLNAIQDLLPLTDSTILVGTMCNALLFHLRTSKLEDLSKKVGLSASIQVHQMIAETPTQLWLGTEAGLLIINTRTWKATLVQKQRDNPYSISDNVIYTLYKDRQGGTWMGTFFGGVNYYAEEYNTFQKYFPHEGSNNLSGNLVHEIVADDYGHLWVGTEDAGLNKIDLRTGVTKKFMPGGKGSISYRNIHGLLVDSNELWIGTYEHGLDVMDIKTEKVIRHYDANTGPGSLSGNFIVTLSKTSTNQVLVGTWTGLFRYNRSSNTFTADPFFGMQIQSVHEDKEGTLWVASYGKGIYYFNQKTGEKGNLKFETDNPNSLWNNYVNSIYEDNEENIWCCTEGGLNKYNKRTKTFIHYNVNEGLPDNQVFRIIQDNSGTLWASTSKGLVSFTAHFKDLHVYTTENGLISNQFNYNSSFKTKEGTLYFGTLYGMISFRPDQFTVNNFTPPVYITGLEVNNREEPISSKSLLKESITYANSISVSYDSSSLSFDVAALSYTTPQLNTYAYKMDGFDKEWTTISTNRKIYYTKLPPGNYVFRLKGSNAGNTWNNKEVLLAIHVLPPIWASIWAYILYAIIVGGIITIIIRYYLLAQHEQARRRFEIFEREKEREVYNSKIDFFTNVAHEIRTPLTLIKLPFDKLLQKVNDPEINDSLITMKKNINRLIDLTNQLLDFRKAEANKFTLNFIKTDVNEAITEVYQAFAPIAEHKACQYKLELPRIALQAYVDHESFQKILSNLFSNAVKYAESKVHIRLMPFNSEDNYFQIQVSNDGHKIPIELKDKIFEPFYRMKGTEKQEGTGIGLPLSRSLAELHKGTLELQASDNEINMFVLSLPIHQDREVNFITNEGEQINGTERLDAELADSGPAERPAVLLVEDNKEILDFIRKELKATYTIYKACNGVEAIEVLQKDNIHLVISDIMMPVMNGIDFCKNIKKDLQFSHIPVILLTAKNTMSSRIEGLEVGADAYIEKPFSLDHLQAQISNLLTNRQIVKEYFARSPLSHIKGIACSSADKAFLEQLQQAINENITNLDLDVDQLSRMVNMSRPTLYRKIKALSNLSPNELINLSRLKKAAELLSSGNYKINEVANMVGYTIQSNFSRDFQKQFGVTPTAYINSLQEEKI
jgi:ligand-binding sensor domain-containing protein/signal transduction histidine kinase/DNA-binding response OmpR family regulator